jgi:hypothetical protein
VVPNRFWTLTEFTAAIALANARLAAALSSGDSSGDASGDSSGGFELVASYGDFDETTALDAPAAWRMILVLRAA